ncbi:MAG: hypothetical protein K6D96_08620 [Acetatifactor sp.]|nr:hypothetical protein [Acetatifactor sp.]
MKYIEILIGAGMLFVWGAFGYAILSAEQLKRKSLYLFGASVIVMLFIAEATPDYGSYIKEKKGSTLNNVNKIKNRLSRMVEETDAVWKGTVDSEAGASYEVENQLAHIYSDIEELYGNIQSIRDVWED